MKKALISILALLPFIASAQGNWTAPTKQSENTTVVKTNEKKASEKTAIIVIDGQSYTVKAEDAPYLKGAIPEVDGKVSFRIDVPLEGRKAADIYNAIYANLEKLVHEPSQTERSRIALVNEEEHCIVASVEEWLVFSDKILVLDRARFNYLVQAECKDGMLHLSIDRLYYDYERNGGNEHFLAEGFITDDVMLSKDGTKLKKMNSKFRKATVDRMNDVMAKLTFIR